MRIPLASATAAATANPRRSDRRAALLRRGSPRRGAPAGRRWPPPRGSAPGRRWRRRRSWSGASPRRPPSPTVSTMENPHGDHAPVSPTRSAAAARLTSSGLIAAPVVGVRSAWDVRLVVGDAEHLPAAVAVAVQGGVAVDPPIVMGAAIPELAHGSPAAPIPGALRMRLDSMLLGGVLADLGPRGRWQRESVGIANEARRPGESAVPACSPAGRRCRPACRRRDESETPVSPLAADQAGGYTSRS